MKDLQSLVERRMLYKTCLGEADFSFAVAGRGVLCRNRRRRAFRDIVPWRVRFEPVFAIAAVTGMAAATTFDKDMSLYSDVSLESPNLVPTEILP